MQRRRQLVGAALLLALMGMPAPLAAQSSPPQTRSFANGLPADPDFFPIAVWLQRPERAAAYRALGVNTYVGLWKPPTQVTLADLARQDMYLIVQQTPQALALKNSPVIRGWLQADEPDNAQPDGRGGYGDCIMPDELVRLYQGMRALDPTRPVFLGFGQAVANPYWNGRGSRCNKIAPADYYKPASAGGDILAFDIYPVVHDHPAIGGKLEFVGKGVANLKGWASPNTPIWADIETTHINNRTRRPTPSDVRSEVWIAIIHGAMGINYFAHEWQPSFREDGVFRYSDVTAEMKRINAQLKGLAPVLNTATLVEGGRAETPPVDIATMAKRHAGSHYLFTVNMTNKPAQARLRFGKPINGQADVLDEERKVNVSNGSFDDAFAPYAVHIYKMASD